MHTLLLDKALGTSFFLSTFLFSPWQMAMPLVYLRLNAPSTFHIKPYENHHFLASPKKPTSSRLTITAVSQSVQAKDASSAMESGTKLLDIRPPWERSKAYVEGSLHIPLFVEDKDNSLITLLKKWVHFGYIGLWTGQKFTTLNDNFMTEVENAVPDKEAELLVACGEGLRSLIAVRKLSENGYKNLSWLAGGFNRARSKDFHEVVEVSSKLQFATIGGASYFFLQLLLLLGTIPE